jgi:hypothetical protein
MTATRSALSFYREVRRAPRSKRRHVESGTAAAHCFFMSSQKRGAFDVIKSELYRGSAIEAFIGHMNTNGRLGSRYLKGAGGDAANGVLSASRLLHSCAIKRRLI